MRARFDSRPLLSRRNYTTALAQAAPGGSRNHLVHAAHLLCVIVASVISRNVANQELLDSIGPRVLGQAYIAVSLVTGFTLASVGWLSRNVEPRLMARSAHAIVAVLIGLSYLASWFYPEAHNVIIAKYITLEISTAALLLVFGLMLGARLGPRDARRSASVVGVGGIIGGLIGGAGLKFGALWLGSAQLYLLAALFAFAPALFLPAVPKRAQDPDRATVDRGEVSALAPYGRWVAITTLLMVATTTVIDFQYRAAASSWFASDKMTSFFGDVALLTGLATLFLQLTVVNRLLNRVGLFATATVMPAALVVFSGAFGLFPGVLSLVFLKLVDSGTNMSVQQATGGLLLAPLGPRARAVWQSRIDGLAKRGGQAIAGLYLAASTWSPVRLVPVVLMLCAMWLVSVLITRLRYVHLLTDMLGAPGSDEPEVSAYDGETLRLLLRELPRAAPTRAAVILDLLEDAGHQAPHLALLELAAGDASGAVALRVVEHYANLGNVDGLRGFSKDKNVDIAGNALIALAELAPEAAAHRSRELLTGSEVPDVLRALAAGVLVERDTQALALCRRLARSEDDETRLAAARALEYARPSRSTVLSDTLSELASDDNSEVARAAMKALAQHPSAPFIDVALRAVHRRELRGAAMRALAEMGVLAASRVATELRRHQNDPYVASALTWVLGRMGSRSGIDALVDVLIAQHVETRLAAAVALTSVYRKHPQLPLPQERIAEHYSTEIAFFHSMRKASASKLPRSPAGELLQRALKQRSKASLECLFRLFALRYPEDAIQGAFAGIASSDSRQRQIALELLHTVLEPGVGAALAAAVTPPRRNSINREETKRLLTSVATDKDRFVGGLARAVLVELRLAPSKALGDAMTQSLVNQVLELQALSLFSHSSAEDLAEVASLVRAKNLDKGITIFREGDAPDACYLLRSGAIAITRGGKDIDRLGPGDACGIVAILDQLPRESSAITVSECSVFEIRADDLAQLLADRPLLMHSIFRALTQAIRAQVDRVALEKRI
ncbi:MAG: cyclic nucleotide-binding domain-containing protein [Myxococcota bacterium]